MYMEHTLNAVMNRLNEYQTDAIGSVCAQSGQSIVFVVACELGWVDVRA